MGTRLIPKSSVAYSIGFFSLSGSSLPRFAPPCRYFSSLISKRTGLVLIPDNSTTSTKSSPSCASFLLSCTIGWMKLLPRTGRKWGFYILLNPMRWDFLLNDPIAVQTLLYDSSRSQTLWRTWTGCCVRTVPLRSRKEIPWVSWYAYSSCCFALTNY